MPLQKLQFKPGVDRENTRYAAEGGWYETNKVRFRRGMPQKIGGWVRLSNAFFLGICRSMLNWITLGGQNLVSVGTNLKYYIERVGLTTTLPLSVLQFLLLTLYYLFRLCGCFVLRMTLPRCLRG
jgi:hypothetical protein